MHQHKALNLESFWQIQIIGWSCFYIYDLLSSMLALLGKRESIDEETLPLALMFVARRSHRSRIVQLKGIVELRSNQTSTLPRWASVDGCG